MNKIEMNGQYTAKKVLSGNGARGAWKLVVVEDDKGKNSISIFVDPATEISDNQRFTIKGFKSLSFGQRQDKNTQKWFPNVSCDLEIEVVPSDFTGITFEEVDGPMPWDMPSSPFPDVDPVLNGELPL